MMNHKESILRLNANTQTEESFVRRIGSEYLIAVDSVRGLDNDAKARIKLLITRLIDDSKKHERWLKELEGYINKNPDRHF